VTTGDVTAELQRLAEEVQGCTRCDLYRDASHGVPGEGPPDSNILLVGEAPGRNEDRQGRPFVGAAGQFLEQLLALAGLRRSDVYITNVVKHWPNQDNGRYRENRAPEPAEILACRPFLDRQIRLIDPRVIVTLGRFSLATFFPGVRISDVHGQVREHDGRFFFHMYHPAAALHQQSLRDTLMSDMRKLTEFLREPLTEEQPEARVQELDNPADPEQLTLF